MKNVKKVLLKILGIGTFALIAAYSSPFTNNVDATYWTYNCCSPYCSGTCGCWTALSYSSNISQADADAQAAANKASSDSYCSSNYGYLGVTGSTTASCSGGSGTATMSASYTTSYGCYAR